MFPTAAGPTPLKETSIRLTRIYQRFGFEVGIPVGDAWISISDACSPEEVIPWLDQLTHTTGGRRDVAASYLGMWFAGVVARPLTALYLHELRAPASHLSHAAIRRLPDGRIDRLALPNSAMFALANDPGARHSDTRVVTNRNALADLVADNLFVLLDPFMIAIRANASYGRRGLWGSVADMIGGGSLQLARHTGMDQWTAWAEAWDLIERLAIRGASVNNRPRPLPIQWSGGETLFTVKGTCCLRYKDRGCSNATYCSSCPLTEDEPRALRYLQKVQAT